MSNGKGGLLIIPFCPLTYWQGNFAHRSHCPRVPFELAGDTQLRRATKGRRHERREVEPTASSAPKRGQQGQSPGSCWLSLRKIPTASPTPLAFDHGFRTRHRALAAGFWHTIRIY